MKSALKTIARGIATVLVLPAVASYRIRALIIGKDRALEGSSQLLSLLPGITGQYLRAAFFSLALEHCDPGVVIGMGTLFSKVGARLDKNVYIGPKCHIGLVHLQRDVLVGPGVHIPSGTESHGTSDATVPIRDQPGTLALVRIGAGSWIGSGAIVMADIGQHTVVGAGSVVTRPLPERVVAAGVPARVLKSRA